MEQAPFRGLRNDRLCHQGLAKDAWLRWTGPQLEVERLDQQVFALGRNGRPDLERIRTALSSSSMMVTLRRPSP
jgi:hypothetical protein